MFIYSNYTNYYKDVDVPILKQLKSIVVNINIDRYIPEDITDIYDVICKEIYEDINFPFIGIKDIKLGYRLKLNIPVLPYKLIY